MIKNDVVYNNMIIWKPISGFEGLYEVSNTGEVRSVDRIVETKYKNNYIEKFYKGKRIKGSPNPSGHLTVTLPDRKKKYIHTIVLETFVGQSEGMLCRHLNGNPADNRVENLQWGTHLENSQDAKDHRQDEIAALKAEIVRLTLENNTLKQLV